MRSSPRGRIIHQPQSTYSRITVGKNRPQSVVPRSLCSGSLSKGTLLEILCLGGLIWGVFGLIPIITATNGAAARASMVLNDPISSLTSICAGKSLLIHRGNSELVTLDLDSQVFHLTLKLNRGVLAGSCVSDDGRVSIHSVDAQEIMILRNGELIVSEMFRRSEDVPWGSVVIGISMNGSRAIRVLRGTDVRCWDCSQDIPVESEFTLKELAEKIVLDREGNRLFVATQPGNFQSYDLRTGELLQSLSGVGPLTAKPVISGDGLSIALVQDRSITRYDVATNQKSWTVQLTEQHSLLGSSLSPNGKWLAVGGASGPVHILDFSTGQVKRTLLEVKSLGAFAFSSCSDKLYAGGLDGAVSTWSVREGIQMGHIKPN